MRVRNILLSFCFAGFLLVSAQETFAGEWSQFLGPQRDGTTSEGGLIDTIPADGPEIVWRVPAGAGMSAVTVSDGIAYTTWNEGRDQVLVAMEALTGQQVWKSKIGNIYKNQMGDGPRATPAIDKNTVYAYTGDGVLSAVEAKTGKMRWQVDLMKMFSAEPSDYGMSSSPLVVDGQVIVHVGGEGSAVVSLDASTGRPRWKAGSGQAGYSSPTVATLHGVPQVISITGTELLGIDIEDGQVLWSYPFETDYACNTASPVIVDNSVFISSGENHGCAMLDIEKSSNGWVANERWESTYAKSVMRNEWQTSIVIDGYLYGFDNVGAAGPVTHLSCIETATGKPVWREARFGKGNMVLADGKLWITTMDGELVLVTPEPAGFNKLGSAQFFEGTRQTMSIASGLGYIRGTNEVVCVKLSKP